MKLNLGCGFNKLADFINIDSDVQCQPDVVHDLDVTPWPFESDQFSHVVANHVLEHLGATTASWVAVIKELWRVCRNQAVIEVTVPHPRHENFLHDPTHVRVVTPIGLAMFDQQRNQRDLESKGQETKLGFMTGVDLEVTQVGYDFCEPWKSAFERGELQPQQMEFELATKNNVCLQIRILLKVHKPARIRSV